MTYDFNIESVQLAMYIDKSQSATSHKYRTTHGLAININDDKNNKKIYTFNSGLSLSIGLNELIYLPKNSSYNISTINPGGCYAINFNLSEDIELEPFIFKPKNITEIVNYFKSTAKIWGRKQISYQMQCKANLYNIISLIQKEHHLHYTSLKTGLVIAPALEYIHRNYTKENILISDLSKMCEISENYFRIIFKNVYGTSPQKYINALRISYVKELIASGLYTITEAAEMSGYIDMCYFSRAFKKAEGISPSTFQKNIYNGL